jgi:hypothetical protein
VLILRVRAFISRPANCGEDEKDGEGHEATESSELSRDRLAGRACGQGAGSGAIQFTNSRRGRRYFREPFDRGHRRDEAITHAGNGLDETGFFGVIAQDRADFTDGSVDAVFGIDPGGNPTGGTQILEQVTLSPDGNHYSGKFTFRAYDIDGNPTLAVTGVLTATRITPNTPFSSLL